MSFFTYVAACLLCSLAPVSAFSASNPPWMKPLSIRPKLVCGSLSPHQLKKPISALSMSLDAQLLKPGIAAYGVIIGAGGIVAGIAVFASRDYGLTPTTHLLSFSNVRYQGRQQAVDHFFNPGKHLARNCVQGNRFLLQWLD
jgi:hypothetical protein